MDNAPNASKDPIAQELTIVVLGKKLLTIAKSGRWCVVVCCGVVVLWCAGWRACIGCAQNNIADDGEEKSIGTGEVPGYDMFYTGVNNADGGTFAAFYCGAKRADRLGHHAITPR